MRQDCSHYQSRTYDDGEVARFCSKDLAPEAPWRCPEPCHGYERLLIMSADFERGSLANVPDVESEPDAPVEDIVDVLAEAESIVANAAPGVVAELEHSNQTKRSWWRRRRRNNRDDGTDDGDFRLSNR